ncbi:MAG: protein-tyrosine-phosphatase, partial [Solirubrobacteraceae bacterium]
IDAIFARLVRSPTYRHELEGDEPGAHAPVPGTMERFFEIVDHRLGGVGAWLESHGLGGDDIDRLRRRLIG